MKRITPILITLVSIPATYLLLQLRYERQQLDKFGKLLIEQGPCPAAGRLNLVQHDLDEMVDNIVHIQINTLSSTNEKRAGKLLNMYNVNTRAFKEPRDHQVADAA